MLEAIISQKEVEIEQLRKAVAAERRTWKPFKGFRRGKQRERKGTAATYLKLHKRLSCKVEFSVHHNSVLNRKEAIEFLFTALTCAVST